MIDRAGRAATAVVVLGFLVSGLGGCETETASGTPTTPVPPKRNPEPTPQPDGVPRVSTPQPVPDGHVRVTGMVFSASGEGTAPERPFERGKIVAVPLERFLSIQKALKPDLVIGEYLQQSLALPTRLLEEKGVGVGDLGVDGTYAVTVRPGPYAWCLVELGGRRREGTPPSKFWIERWTEVTVTGDALQTVLPVYNRTTGEMIVLY